jgi:ribose transport system permease protein
VRLGRRRVRPIDLAPAALFVLALAAAASQSSHFLTLTNAAQIVGQAAPLIVVATGMTFVLLVGGVDLSVGALMFIGAGLTGHLAANGHPLWLSALVLVAVGLAGGALNALLITRLRLLAFIATLAMLYIGRGLGRWITETRAMNLPQEFLDLGSAAWLGLPAPAWVGLAVASAGQFLLSRTPFGRHLYALGADPDAARTLGLPIARLTATVYVISGACAGVGGLLALARLGAVSPRFGELYEFEAITACVLGGASLYGGRGRVLPGAVLGALLLQTIFAALVAVQADPYTYPLVTAALIFGAVVLDALRRRPT